MKFCSACGSTVVFTIPDGDNRERHVCTQCGFIHYDNPKIVTGCLVVHGEHILLCRRAIAPREGLWTLPAGFLERGESTSEGAARETWEEACAKVEIHGLYTMFDLPHISQIYMFYRSRLDGASFSAGAESLEVELFAERDIPWDELAFPVVERTLKHYFDDRLTGDYPVRTETIIRRPA